MVVVPTLLPVTMPDVIPALAIVVSALLHVPLPPTVLDRTLYEPLQIVVSPVIGIGWYCVATNLVL
jgi:hypothetical protein